MIIVYRNEHEHARSIKSTDVLEYIKITVITFP